MTKKHSTDGFIARRPGSQLDSGYMVQKVETNIPVGLRRASGAREEIQSTASRHSTFGVKRDDIDDSLKAIDTTIDEPKGKKRRKKGGKKSKKWRIIKWVLIILVIIGIGFGGMIIYKALHAGNSIFKGSILDIVQNQPLKQDANGRSNILVVGTSLDDPGHDAGWLTDSIMVVSVDQKNKNAYMVSIPRDLEVEYGQACMTGYRGKVNVYFSCVGGGNGDIEADRAALTKEAGFIGGILGLDIQYGVNVNYTVMRELVGAVGGITVTIESDNPKGVLDQNFDWKCGLGDYKVSAAERIRRCPPNGHYIEYPNGPVNLDAEHALYLAQARGDCVPIGNGLCKATYGFERSNFDREKNQQKIVKAIREKAMSLGVLTNFSKVAGIIDALGNNLRTTFQANEFRTLVDLAKNIKDQDIQSISLIDGDNPVMKGDGNPSAGMYQYGAIRELIKKKLTSNPVTREEASVVVLNGSGVPGVAKTESDKLAALGFIISDMGNAPTGTALDVDVYQITGTDKPATKAKLESVYGIKVKTTPPPVAAEAGVNFVVIIGKDRSAKN